MQVSTTETRTYAYGSLRLGVTCADPSLFTWLEEFLTPSFRVSHSPGADWQLSVVHDPDRYEAMLARGPRDLDTSLECFTHDGHYKTHPLWERATDQVTFWIDTHRCFTTLRYAERQIELLHGQRKARPRLAAMRLLRELATVDRRRRGHLHLHASAFVAADGTVCAMTGPKRSGKSSSLIHALHDPAARYLTNDRLFIHEEDGAWNATGMPTIVSVRPQSFELFPRLGREYQRLGYRTEYTLGESLTARPPQSLKVGQPASLSPAQFCSLLGAQAVGSRPLGAILFPSITNGVLRSRLRPLSRDEAAAMLYQNIFRPGQGSGIAEAYRTRADEGIPGEDHFRSVCHAVASAVDCYRLHLGPQAYDEITAPLPMAA